MRPSCNAWSPHVRRAAPTARRATTARAAHANQENRPPACTDAAGGGTDEHAHGGSHQDEALKPSKRQRTHSHAAAAAADMAGASSHQHAGSQAEQGGLGQRSGNACQSAAPAPVPRPVPRPSAVSVVQRGHVGAGSAKWPLHVHGQATHVSLPRLLQCPSAVSVVHGRHGESRQRGLVPLHTILTAPDPSCAACATGHRLRAKSSTCAVFHALVDSPLPFTMLQAADSKPSAPGVL